MCFKTAPAYRILFLLVLFTLPPLTGCSNHVAGAVSETTNGQVAGILTDTAGIPLPNTLITIRHADYTVDDSLTLPPSTITTDDSGYYSFDSLTPGHYILMAKGKQSQIIALNKTIDTSHTTTLDTITLQSSGSLSGQLLVHDRGRPVKVHLLGLELFIEPDSLGYFHFPSVPAGIFTIRIVFYNAGKVEKDTYFDESTIHVNSKEHNDIGYLFPAARRHRDEAIALYTFALNGYYAQNLGNLATAANPDNLSSPITTVNFGSNIIVDTLPPLFTLLDSLTHFTAKLAPRYTTIPEQLFAIRSLKTVDLRNAYIETVDDKIRSWTNLVDLNLNGNRIRNLPLALVNHPSLSILRLNDNKLSALPSEITNSTIIQIWVDNNFLSSLSPDLTDWLNTTAYNKTLWQDTQK